MFQGDGVERRVERSRLRIEGRIDRLRPRGRSHGGASGGTGRQECPAVELHGPAGMRMGCMLPGDKFFRPAVGLRKQ